MEAGKNMEARAVDNGMVQRGGRVRVTRERLREIAEAYYKAEIRCRPTYAEMTVRFACSRSTVARALLEFRDEYETGGKIIGDTPSAKFARKLHRELRLRYNGMSSTDLAASMGVHIDVMRRGLQRLRVAGLVRSERSRWFVSVAKGG